MPSAPATRFDVLLDQSAAAPGATVTGGVYPCCGTWKGGSVTLTRAGGETINVTLPSGGADKVGFSFTAGRAGDEVLTPSNSAGLRNPAPALLSVFAPSSGRAQALSLGTQSKTFIRQRVFQQATWRGTPTGWTGINGATFDAGWGRVPFVFASGAPALLTQLLGGDSGALFARLIDADSSGASPAGGGTIISRAAQVYGAVPSGRPVPIMVPASDYCVYIEFATDAAMTQPVRVPIPFFVRDVIAIDTRSQEDQLWGSFPYPGPPGNTAWSTYQRTTGLGAQQTGYGVVEYDDGGWGRADGTHTFGTNGQPYGGVGGQELGRMFKAIKGAGVGIVGCVPAGGELDVHWQQDGAPYSTLAALIAACDGEFRYLIVNASGWSNHYAPMSYDEYVKVYHAIPQRMMSLYPSLAVCSLNAASGIFGFNGSQLPDGYTRLNAAIRDQELVDPCVTASDANSDWNEYYSNSGHSSHASAIRYARARARSLLLSESPHARGFGRSPAERYAMFGKTATMAAGSGLIRVPFTLPPGARALVAKQWANGTTSAAGWVYSTPNAARLAQLVTVYRGAGQRFVTGNDTNVVPVTGVAIDNAAGTLNIAVARSVSAPLTVQVMADFGRSTSNPANPSQETANCVGLFDDRDLGDGCGYGPGARSQIDIAVS